MHLDHSTHLFHLFVPQPMTRSKCQLPKVRNEVLGITSYSTASSISDDAIHGHRHVAMMFIRSAANNRINALERKYE
jgi:hypothetical protein